MFLKACRSILCEYIDLFVRSALWINTAVCSIEFETPFRSWIANRINLQCVILRQKVLLISIPNNNQEYTHDENPDIDAAFCHSIYATTRLDPKKRLC